VGFSTKSSLLRFEAELPQFEAETAVCLFDAWLDRIEAVVRDRVREFIHATLPPGPTRKWRFNHYPPSRAWRKSAIDPLPSKCGASIFHIPR
jgi:hypothetical protein